MRVKLGEISADGLSVSADLKDDWARESAALSLDGEIQVLEFKARVQRVSDCVRVAGALEARVHRACDRCQTSLEITLSGDVDLYYAPPRAGEVGDRDLDAGDMDIGWFDGDGLELSQVISEQLAIWCPDWIYCDGESSRRLEDPEGPCQVLEHGGGPELKKDSPFAGLRLPE